MFSLPSISVNSLTLSATTKSGASNTTRKLYIWNYTTHAWVTIAQDTVGTTESTTSATVSTNLSNYINNGSVTMGVQQYSSATMSVNFVQLKRQ